MMNILLILTVLLLTTFSIDCTLKLPGRTGSSGEIIRANIDAQYICTSDSKLKKVERLDSYKIRVPCSGYKQVYQHLFYNITLKGRDRDEDRGKCRRKDRNRRKKEKVITLSLRNSETTFRFINGNSYHHVSAYITDSKCRGGKVTVTDFNINYDCLACITKQGAASLESVKATFEIKGGKCESKCFGTLRVRYDHLPKVVEFSDGSK